MKKPKRAPRKPAATDPIERAMDQVRAKLADAVGRTTEAIARRVVDAVDGALMNTVVKYIDEKSTGPLSGARITEETDVDAAMEDLAETLADNPPAREPVPRPAPNPNKPFQCADCGFAAETQRGLTKHRTARHSGSPQSMTNQIHASVKAQEARKAAAPVTRLDAIRNRAGVVTAPKSAPPTTRNIPDPFARLPRDPDDSLLEEDDDVA